MIEILFENTQLRCYEEGKIELFRKGQWKKWVDAGTVNAYGYVKIVINYKKYNRSRLLMMAFKNFDINSELCVDHKNHIRHDDRIENLRIVTHQENMFNKSNTKGYYYVANAKKKKWRMRLMVNGKPYTKCFETELESKNHYLEKKAELHIILNT